MEHPKRSFLKAVTWRAIAFLTTMIVVYVYTGSMKESLVVGISANLIKFYLYYLHERLWDKVKYGKKQPEYQI